MASILANLPAAPLVHHKPQPLLTTVGTFSVATPKGARCSRPIENSHCVWCYYRGLIDCKVPNFESFFRYLSVRTCEERRVECKNLNFFLKGLRMGLESILVVKL